MMDDVVEDDAAVDDLAAVRARRRRCLCRHIQGGEAEARGVIANEMSKVIMKYMGIPRCNEKKTAVGVLVRKPMSRGQRQQDDKQSLHYGRSWELHPGH